MRGLYRRVRHGTRAELVPLTSEETWVRVDGVLSDAVWQAVAALLSDHPDVTLSIESGSDLEPLRHMPFLRRLNASSLDLRSLDGLRHVTRTLDVLSIGDTLRHVSLRPLADLGVLRDLELRGRWRDLDTLSRLTGLERLAIGSVDVELLLPLSGLRQFTSGLGTVRNIDLLPEVGRLELVELFRLRLVRRLDVLGRLTRLRWLTLTSMHAIAVLPSFQECLDLRWVDLSAMRGITDLQPVADAPNLEVLRLSMPHLSPDTVACFAGHPSLRVATCGFGSFAKNAAARALLPGVRTDDAWNDPDWDGIVRPIDS